MKLKLNTDDITAIMLDCANAEKKSTNELLLCMLYRVIEVGEVNGAVDGEYGKAMRLLISESSDWL